MGLKRVLLTLGLNTLGTAAYAINVSGFRLQSQSVFERVANSASNFLKDGLKRLSKFFGASHQWLHIMVILAGLDNTVGILHVFDFLHARPNWCLGQ
jgi:adiponectin receptor